MTIVETRNSGILGDTAGAADEDEGSLQIKSIEVESVDPKDEQRVTMNLE